MRISDWSSDVCSSDLSIRPNPAKTWLLRTLQEVPHRLLSPPCISETLEALQKWSIATFRPRSHRTLYELRALALAPPTTCVRHYQPAAQRDAKSDGELVVTKK